MNEKKVILKDGTEFAIEEISYTDDMILHVFEWSEVEPVMVAFSKKGNLDRFQFTLNGAVSGVFENYKFKDLSVAPEEGGYALHIHCTEKSETDLLREEMELLKASQTIQDEAIEDLGEVVSEIVEGGGE